MSMALDARTRAVLERRGVGNIRALLQNVAIGQGAEVRLEGLPAPLMPSRAQVEEWLREKELEEEQLAQAGVDWARRAFWAALVSILVGIVGIVVAAIFGWLALPPMRH